MNDLKIEIWPIGRPRFYQNNPRNIDKAVNRVAASISAFGFRSPIIVDGEGVIIAGHTRLMAARKLALDEIPVIVRADLSKEQADALRIIDNKISETSEWENKALKEELQALKLEGFEMDVFGFITEKPKGEEIQKEEEEETEATTKPGDLWLLGEHRLLCGDSTDKRQVAKLLDGARVDMVLTDPPYNVAYKGHRTERKEIKNDDLGDQFPQFIRDVMANAIENVDGAIYVCFPVFEMPAFFDAFKIAGGEIGQLIFWVKSNNFVISFGNMNRQHEPIIYGWPKGQQPPKVYGNRSDVWEFKKPIKSGIHPTMKPLDLFGEALRASTRKGDRVLDLFGGSGTTLIAAQTLGRKAYLMELDPHYCDAIVQRWEELTGETAERVPA